MFLSRLLPAILQYWAEGSSISIPVWRVEEKCPGPPRHIWASDRAGEPDGPGRRGSDVSLLRS